MVFEREYWKARNSCLALFLLHIMTNDVVSPYDKAYLNKVLQDGYMEARPDLFEHLENVRLLNRKKIDEKNFNQLLT
jgi:hypothetical protein